MVFAAKGVCVAGDILRRKLQAAANAMAEGGPGADRAWRLSFARAARDMMHLPVDFLTLAVARHSLSEVLDFPPERSLILMLEGPQEGLGLLILSPDLLNGLIEVLTLGRCGPQVPVARKPTRTDAAMLAPLADLALANLEEALAEESDLIWTSGFRFASYIEEARSLALLLEDISYCTLRAKLSLAQGARQGEMLLILPAEGKGSKPRLRANSLPDAVAGPAFSAALSYRVEGADCQLNAILAKLSMSLSQTMALTVDTVLPLPKAGLDRIALQGIDGKAVAEGQLGQHRGMRAVRLAMAEDSDFGLPNLGLSAASPTASQWQNPSDDAPGFAFQSQESDLNAELSLSDSFPPLTGTL
jgi:flagellar motor switch protein FliM